MKTPMPEFRILYERPVDARLAGALVPGTFSGLTFEHAPDELTARFQFMKRMPTAIITTISEVKS